MSKPRTARRPRRLRARPLLVATGAALLTAAVAGCGDDTPFCADHGICATMPDLAVPNLTDMGLFLRGDMGLIPSRD